MDDGGICSNSFKFSVDCFTESDINLLQKMLLTKFNIKTTKEIFMFLTNLKKLSKNLFNRIFVNVWNIN